MLRRGASIGEQAFVFGAAEIRALEQLRREHHLGAFARGLSRQLAYSADIHRRVVGESELQCGDGQFAQAGTCCEMQWKLPPPVRMWSARRPFATRSGNRACTASTAASSFAAPYCGTT